MKKKHTANGRATIGVLNLVTPNMPTEVGLGVIYRSKTEHWFRFGNDNLFPQALAAINRKSPVHRSVLHNKIIYCSGSKIFLTKEGEKNSMFNDFLLLANGNNETLRKINKKMTNDKLSFGNAYMEIVTDENRSFICFFHKDTTTARIGKESNEGLILLHPSWANVYNTKRKIKKLPVYPQFEKIDGYLRSIVHIKDYEPEYSNYGIPTWVAGMDAAAIAYKTNKWNISRLDNSFALSGSFILDGNISEPDAKKLKAELIKTHSGEGNQGKVSFIIKQLGGEGTKFIPFTDSKDGDWLNLQKQSAQDVITSHNWFRALSGLDEGSSLGNGAQIKTVFEIAKNTIIAEVQNSMMEVYQDIFTRVMGWNGKDLKIDTTLPVSLNLGGTEITALINVCNMVDTGQISESSGRFILLKYGCTEEEISLAFNDMKNKSFKGIIAPQKIIQTP